MDWDKLEFIGGPGAGNNPTYTINGDYKALFFVNNSAGLVSITTIPANAIIKKIYSNQVWVVYATKITSATLKQNNGGTLIFGMPN